MNDEWSRYYRQPALHDLEVLHARFVRHAFARHSHDYYVVGCIESGVQAYRYRGARHLTSAGQIFLVNPGEPHTGEAATAHGYVYRTVYPRVPLMQQLARELGNRATLPFFKSAVIRDEVLAASWARFHRAVAQRAPALSIESYLMLALADLIARQAGQCAGPRRITTERAVTRGAREYIDAHFATDISLSQLATTFDRSPYHLARAFSNEVGLPPHCYLHTVRIRRARELLDAAVPISEVSIAVGYADQSHFTHRFKRLLGITPAQYARGPGTRLTPYGCQRSPPPYPDPAPARRRARAPACGRT
jgi:AraC-like DNA-binding protein